jgi:hypothetical protein
VSLKDELRRFLDELESIAEKHEEVTDTDVREILHRTLNHFFVWGGRPVDRLPTDYGMFSTEGNDRVAHAVRTFLERALAVADVQRTPAGKRRLDLLQDPSIRTKSGRQYDDFLGHVESPLPFEPLPAFWFRRSEER